MRGLFGRIVLAGFMIGSWAPPAQAAPGGFSDADDVDLPLDLKNLTHDHPGSEVVYTVETYDGFEDSQADFKWALDSNNDQKVDRFVSVEFEGGKLVAKVEDAREDEIGGAAVSRIGPQSLRISFSRDLIGTTSYRYRVAAVTDKNRNDEDDTGETDMAPDNGFHLV